MIDDPPSDMLAWPIAFAVGFGLVFLIEFVIAVVLRIQGVNP